MLSLIDTGDVLVADRAYVSYEITARLMEANAHLIGRCHHSRKVNFRKGKKLGPNQRLQTWRKPNWQPPGSCLSNEQWQQLPDEIEVRVIRQKWTERDGKSTTKYLFTTLLDADKYPAQEIASLYFERWEIEVRFRDIKTTMGMDMLRTKSPAMIRKELMMHMVAYNLVRLLMLKAAAAHGVSARGLSFKGALQVLAASSATFAQAERGAAALQQEKAEFLKRIAERQILNRPGRNEPRKVKRRPKSSRWLQVPRRQDPGYFRTVNPQPKIFDQAA